MDSIHQGTYKYDECIDVGISIVNLFPYIQKKYQFEVFRLKSIPPQIPSYRDTLQRPNFRNITGQQVFTPAAINRALQLTSKKVSVSKTQPKATSSLRRVSLSQARSGTPPNTTTQVESSNDSQDNPLLFEPPNIYSSSSNHSTPENSVSHTPMKSSAAEVPPITLSQAAHIYKRGKVQPNFTPNTKASPSTPVFDLDEFKPIPIQTSYYEENFLQPKLPMPQDLSIDFIDGSTDNNMQEGLRAIQSSCLQQEQQIPLACGRAESPSNMPSPPYSFTQLYRQQPPQECLFFQRFCPEYLEKLYSSLSQESIFAYAVYNNEGPKENRFCCIDTWRLNC